MKDERKTKAQLIAELHGLRVDNAALHDRTSGSSVSDTEHQLAAERIRSQAMAMRGSDDLYALTATFFTEVRGLGIDTWYLSLAFMEDGKFVTYCFALANWASMGLELRPDRFARFRSVRDDALIWVGHGDREHDFKDNKVQAFETQQVSSAPASGNIAAKRRQVLKNWTGSERDVERVAERLSEDEWYHQVPFSHGVVSFTDPSNRDESTRTMGLLAESFSLGYQRYLDFQKIEQQNRELTVQNALERVRARASGMQESSDIGEVTALLFREFNDLEIPLRRSGICILDVVPGEAEFWLTDPSGGIRKGEPFSTSVMQQHPDMARVYAALQQGEQVVHTELTVTQTVDLVLFLRDHLNIALEFADQDRAAITDVVSSLYPDDRAHVYYVMFPRGMIVLSRTDVLSEEELRIAQRFTDAFDFAYARYLELAAAEQRARQAEIERAAEHIRAEAMAMRGSADLMDVVGMMHQSLHQLGVEPISTSIHFIDEAEEQFQHYLAVRDTEPYGFVLRESPGLNELQAPTKLVEGGWRVRWTRSPHGHEPRLAVWRAGHITTEVISHTTEKVRQGDWMWYAPDPDKADWSVWEPSVGELDYTQVPFKYGVVTFNVQTVSEQHIETVQALTEALSLGYMRFQDFQRLEQASVNKSQFLRRMSHDLRSPMNAIIGYTRLLQRRLADRMDEREARNLGNIETSSGNLLNLINDILDLSRIEAGRIEVNRQSFDPRALARECADSLESIVKEGVILRRDLDEVGFINSDPDRLRQVIMNLLGNATKFTEAGAITLSLKKGDNGSVELSVSDTGIGIPADDLPHIFDEFRQVERQGGEQAEGTGLGLAIAKKTMDLLGGEITATSEVGVGTTFTVRLGTS